MGSCFNGSELSKYDPFAVGQENSQETLSFCVGAYYKPYVGESALKFLCISCFPTTLQDNSCHSQGRAFFAQDHSSDSDPPPPRPGAEASSRLRRRRRAAEPYGRWPEVGRSLYGVLLRGLGARRGEVRGRCLALGGPVTRARPCGRRGSGTCGFHVCRTSRLGVLGAAGHLGSS